MIIHDFVAVFFCVLKHLENLAIGRCFLYDIA